MRGNIKFGGIREATNWKEVTFVDSLGPEALAALENVKAKEHYTYLRRISE